MKTRLIFVGGFLGAGKSSLLLRSAEALKAQGYRPAIVTNDQGQALVDTLLARGQGVDTTEVVGGCVCCRFHDMTAAIQTLTETSQPDVILIEPVGSCTDLIATVIRPLERDFPDQYEVAPFTVLVDPKRDLAGFPASMDDLFHWQVGEADIIAISKSDLLSDTEMDEQMRRFRDTYPDKRIVSLSSRTGEGVSDWLAESLQGVARPRNVVPVDYIVYAEAEACLGWLNATVRLSHESPFSLRAWMAGFLASLDASLRDADAEIAHVKVHGRANENALKAALTGSDQPVDWDRDDELLTCEAVLTVNARVRSEPDALRGAVQAAAQQAANRTGVPATFEHLECFSPAPPEPVFRLL